MTYPWQDRAKRFSPFKLAIFLGLWIPGLWLGIQWVTDDLGPRPLTELIHGTGLWAIRFLILSLAITPFRKIAQWTQLISVRRMIGLAALFYILAHLGFYTADLHFDWGRILSELTSRIYLIIGGTALIGLLVLGLTSTDSAMRKMGGRNWQRLHRSVYAIGLLALIHFFMQSKLDLYQPALVAGLFIWLMSYRLLAKADHSDGILTLLALAIVTTGLSMATEALWHSFMTRIPGLAIFNANFMLPDTIRPSWWVFLAALSMVLIFWAIRQKTFPGWKKTVAANSSAPIAGKN